MASDADPITLTCPYLDNLKWYRGNLHTHTTYSDGTRSLEEVIADYQHRGYDFLCITDHDVLVGFFFGLSRQPGDIAVRHRLPFLFRHFFRDALQD